MASTDDFKQYGNEVARLANAASGIIPVQRALFKKGFSFSLQSFEDQLHIWKYIWRNHSSGRARYYSFFFLEKHVVRKENHQAIWETSRLWQEDVDDWGFCDALA